MSCRRDFITEEEVKTVVNLYKRGYSFLSISRATGIFGYVIKEKIAELGTVRDKLYDQVKSSRQGEKVSDYISELIETKEELVNLKELYKKQLTKTASLQVEIDELHALCSFYKGVNIEHRHFYGTSIIGLNSREENLKS